MSAQATLAPSSDARVVETSAGPIWVEHDGVLRQVFTTRIVHLEHMQDALSALVQLGGPQGGWRMLVDATVVRWGSATAREFAAGPRLAKFVAAQAVLVGSAVSRTIVSFYVRVARPPFPVRIFSSTSRALDWLRSTDRQDPS